MPPRASAIIEQKMQLRATREFISSSPMEVVFTRKEVVRDTEDRGGVVQTAVRELDPQTVRLAYAPPRRRRLENSPPNETFSELSYEKNYLVGMPELDIEINDRFVSPIDGVTYEVLYVFEDRIYKTIANVGTFGG
jgi:hypothetical protein